MRRLTRAVTTVAAVAALCPLLTTAVVAAFVQVLAKADPTALAASAEVVRGKLVTASAIAKGEVRLGVYCSTGLD